MKANLLICLGSPLIGDDGIGWHVLRELSRSQSLPEDLEILYGGTDLLRLTREMEGREKVFLVDAVEDLSPPGSLLVFEGDVLPPASEPKNAHQLCAVEAMRILRLTSNRLNHVRITLIGVSVSSVRFKQELSPELSAQIPQIVEGVKRLCGIDGPLACVDPIPTPEREVSLSGWATRASDAHAVADHGQARKHHGCGGKDLIQDACGRRQDPTSVVEECPEQV